LLRNCLVHKREHFSVLAFFLSEVVQQKLRKVLHSDFIFILWKVCFVSFLNQISFPAIILKKKKWLACSEYEKWEVFLCPSPPFLPLKLEHHCLFLAHVLGRNARKPLGSFGKK
jgi:hypothetical protein